MPYELLILCGVFVLLVPLLLWGADKQLKYFKALNLRNIKIISTSKFSILFLYWNRKTRQISVFVIVSTIVFYIISLTGVAFLITHFLVKVDLYFIIGCSLTGVNFLIIMGLLIKTSPKQKEHKIIAEDRKKQKLNNIK
jgi:lipid-A-disaccharide synthase-like uncharacterized protein